MKPGKFPFMTYANEYMASVRELYADSTKIELRRRLKRMQNDFQALKKNGIIETIDPTKFSEETISAYIGLLKARGVEESGLAHNLSTLKQLLAFCGNPVLEQMDVKHSGTLPKRRSIRYPPMTEKQAGEIIRRSESVRDWKRVQAYCLVVFALCSGLRPKEISLAKVSDLDKENWTILVKHPKGEQSWGKERRAPILPQALPILRRYLAMRASLVGTYAPLNEALFPAIFDGGDGYFASNSLLKLKRVVEKKVGFLFELRACRRTLGQLCIDRGISVESVSIALGHSSTKTTESYYCRKREDVAIREIQTGFDKLDKYPDGFNSVINRGFPPTGYA